MSLSRLISVLAALFIVVVTGRVAFAQVAGQPAGLWRPATGADAPYIQNAGSYISNTDTSAAHTIVSGTIVDYNDWDYWYADWGVPFDIYALNNGGSLVCWVDVTDLTTHGTVETSGSTTTTGYVAFSVLFDTPGSIYLDPTVVSIKCSLPAKNSNGASQLFAAVVE